MTAVDFAELLARWQFGVTTVYHFFFVPVTIALSLLVAVLQTLWVRSGNERYLRLTKFFGKLFLINFAMGVVTGIVQEFQFGMNWSEYSRFVGDIFGAPLALEALIAFFLESVFLGLWIFGWDRLPKKVHLATIWLGAVGTLISSIFILVANAWMQNPVGATYNPVTGRAEMTDLLAVLTNPVALITWPHVIFGSFMVAGGLILGVSAWCLAKVNKEADGVELSAQAAKDVDAHRFAVKLGAWVLLAAAVGTIVTGDIQGKILVQTQPMKMAAAEGLYTTEASAGFAVIAFPNAEGTGNAFELTIPGVLSFLATGSFDGKVEGINDLQAAYAAGQIEPNTELARAAAEHTAKYGVTNFVPDVVASFWSFRFMMLFGCIAILIAIGALVKNRNGGTFKAGKLLTVIAFAAPLLPLFASSFGWIVTEMGRQPWIVNGVLPTAAASSPMVSAFEVGTTLVLYTLIYGAGAVVEVGLFLKTVKAGLPIVEEPKVLENDDDPLSFAY
ncbi:MAG: cytochrome ubiquinol oxidase subunit I [Propionibacteriaceae bacterium]|jgi:cytochrome d ubiquinol oxidase subunit I|nr:cytochrome ubiquinol oxidase subunit I [Propionibacteriaceae bacterium]